MRSQCLQWVGSQHSGHVKDFALTHEFKALSIQENAAPRLTTFLCGRKGVKRQLKRFLCGGWSACQSQRLQSRR
jgi:hypothetical protein